MGKPASDKPALLRLMATHVLEHGLNTASLRPLAKAANTSDRMLIYHFGTKDGLINALLQVVAADLAEKLEGALPSQRAPSVHDCALQIIGLLRRPPYANYMKLWLDIVSASGQGSDSHARAGQAMIEGYLEWLERRLPESTRDKRVTASLVLTLIEGTIVMDAVNQSAIADVALAKLFDH
jgi:AcrR family transcriptional regulator